MKNSIRTCFVVATLALAGPLAIVSPAAETKILADLPYRDAATAVPDEAGLCRLDLYLPAEGRDHPTILWLHGGGMTGGSRKTAVSRRVAARLASAGIAVAMADYRLNPAVKFPAYVDDVAAAFAWLKGNIAQHGGDPKRVFIGGHSAGAYLALMVALDPQYLAGRGLDESALAGVVAISGQAVTHFTVRAERHPGDDRMRVDDAAPLFHAGKRSFPFLLLYASDDMALRVEENRLLAAALRQAGAKVEEHLHEGRDHSTVYTRMNEPGDAVAEQVMRFVLAP